MCMLCILCILCRTAALNLLATGCTNKLRSYSRASTRSSILKRELVGAYFCFGAVCQQEDGSVVLLRNIAVTSYL